MDGSELVCVTTAEAHSTPAEAVTFFGEPNHSLSTKKSAAISPELRRLKFLDPDVDARADCGIGRYAQFHPMEILIGHLDVVLVGANR